MSVLGLTSVLLLMMMSSFVQPARIFCFYPVPFHSHQSVFRVITDELLRRGHELVVVTPYPHEKPVQNLTEIDVKDMSYRMFEEGLQKLQKEDAEIAFTETSFWLKMIYPTIPGITSAEFAQGKVQEILNDDNQHFDLILIEAVVPTSFLAVVKFNAPVIQVSSFFGTEENFYAIGASVHPLLLPEYNFHTVKHYSLYEKVKHVYLYLRLRYIGQMEEEETENTVIRKHFGPNAPTIADLEKRVQMLFLNVHQIWDNNRPVPPSVVYMGSLQLQEPKPLPKDMQNYLDSSKAGVVYVSLGSKFKFSDLPPRTLKTFFKVFETLPYNFLVKWDGGDNTDIPHNMRCEKWLPQNDLLHHPNIRAFITQGGLQSTDEAIAAQVPLIAFPMIADQFYNGAMYEQHGIGVRMNIDNVDERNLNETIVRLAESQSFRNNLRTLAKICKEQRAGGLERAVYWAEYVAKHGASHLRSPLAGITFSEYIMLDVIATVSLALLLSLVSFLFLLRFLISRSQNIFVRLSNKKND